MNFKLFDALHTYSKQVTVVYFQTIDPYPCYHNFQKNLSTHELKVLQYNRLAPASDFEHMSHAAD